MRLDIPLGALSLGHMQGVIYFEANADMHAGFLTSLYLQLGRFDWTFHFLARSEGVGALSLSSNDTTSDD